MAATATAHWYIRTEGAAANGASYDPEMAGAGTNLADAAAGSTYTTVISCLVADSAGRTKLRLTAGTWPADCVGNAIKLTTAGTMTAGYYWCTARDADDLITVDTSPAGGADRTLGTGTMGGAALDLATIGGAGGWVPGNTVWIRGAGTDWPVASDYTMTGANRTDGTATNTIKLRGYNGRPYITMASTLPLLSTGTDFVQYEGLVVKSASGGACFQLSYGSKAIDCHAILVGNTSNGFVCGARTQLHACTAELSGTPTGTAAFSIFSGSDQVFISHCQAIGVATGVLGGGGIEQGIAVDHCLFVNCTTGVDATTGSTNSDWQICSNTFDGCATGVLLQSDSIIHAFGLRSNIFSDCTTGINFETAFDDTTDQREWYLSIDYNAFWNCGTARTNAPAGEHDVTLTGSPYVDGDNAVVKSRNYCPNTTAGAGAALLVDRSRLTMFSAQTEKVHIGAFAPASVTGGGTTSSGFPRRVMKAS